MKTLELHELQQVAGGVSPSDFYGWAELSSEVTNLFDILSHFVDVLQASRS